MWVTVYCWTCKNISIMNFTCKLHRRLELKPVFKTKKLKSNIFKRLVRSYIFYYIFIYLSEIRVDQQIDCRTELNAPKINGSLHACLTEPESNRKHVLCTLHIAAVNYILHAYIMMAHWWLPDFRAASNSQIGHATPVTVDRVEEENILLWS